VPAKVSDDVPLRLASPWVVDGLLCCRSVVDLTFLHSSPALGTITEVLEKPTSPVFPTKAMYVSPQETNRSSPL
jgi:hypothetical protein